MRRLVKVGLACVIVACGLVLNGCGDSGVPAAGLTVIDGRATIVFASCSNRYANVGIYVAHTQDAAAASPAPPSASAGYLDWNVRSDAPRPFTEIPIFGPAPSGWSIAEHSISSLQPGVTYSLTGTGQANAVPVSFTADDLSRLDATHVLVGSGPNGSKIITRNEFNAHQC
jgi:hypothetical protein